MSEDKKEFYKRSLHLDGTNLGRAISTLDSIKGRYKEFTEEVEWIGQFLRGIKQMLILEGWEGYSPDHELVIPEKEVQLPRRSAGFKKTKDLEALPKLQSTRDANRKEISDRLRQFYLIQVDLQGKLLERKEKAFQERNEQLYSLEMNDEVKKNS